MNPPAHCPWCGQAFDPAAALVQEFWAREEHWFVCWCARCRRGSDIAVITSPVITERVTF